MIKPFDQPIHVTRPFLPPLEEYCEGLKEIWDSRLLTNDGPVLRRFRATLSRWIGTPNLCLFSNGTQALEIGIRGLGIKGEVITTPFTFVATAHALHSNGLRPVFADIEPDFYTLDPEKVERAITPNTSAILAVHVYGHVCNLDSLADIARRHHLRLIYDAAHAFGVKVGGKPVGHFGDLSMFSFHATKPFHTMEGGMLTFTDPDLKATFEYLRNFGFKNEVEVVMHGTNAKMNELQALMGETLLAHMPHIVASRRALYQLYRETLAALPGIRVPPPVPDGVTYNYAYMPIEINAAEFGMSRDHLYSELKRYNVYARRYFYPLLSDLECYRNVALTDPLTEARGVASRVLTLPLYCDLSASDVERICGIVNEVRCRRARTRAKDG